MVQSKLLYKDSVVIFIQRDRHEKIYMIFKTNSCNCVILFVKMSYLFMRQDKVCVIERDRAIYMHDQSTMLSRWESPRGRKFFCNLCIDTSPKNCCHVFILCIVISYLMCNKYICIVIRFIIVYLHLLSELLHQYFLPLIKINSKIYCSYTRQVKVYG